MPIIPELRIKRQSDMVMSLQFLSSIETPSDPVVNCLPEMVIPVLLSWEMGDEGEYA